MKNIASVPSSTDKGEVVAYLHQSYQVDCVVDDLNFSDSVKLLIDMIICKPQTQTVVHLLTVYASRASKQHWKLN